MHLFIFTIEDCCFSLQNLSCNNLKALMKHLNSFCLKFLTFIKVDDPYFYTFLLPSQRSFQSVNMDDGGKSKELLSVNSLAR